MQNRENYSALSKPSLAQSIKDKDFISAYQIFRSRSQILTSSPIYHQDTAQFVATYSYIPQILEIYDVELFDGTPEESYECYCQGLYMSVFLPQIIHMLMCAYTFHCNKTEQGLLMNKLGIITQEQLEAFTTLSKRIINSGVYYIYGERDNIMRQCGGLIQKLYVLSRNTSDDPVKKTDLLDLQLPSIPFQPIPLQCIALQAVCTENRQIFIHCDPSVKRVVRKIWAQQKNIKYPLHIR